MAEPLALLYHLLVIGPYLLFPVVLSRLDGRRGARWVRIAWWLAIPVWLAVVSLAVTPPTAPAMAICAWLFVIVTVANWLVIHAWWPTDRGQRKEWRWALAYWLGSLVHATFVVPTIPYGPTGRGLVRCRINLRAIGVAMQSYADAHACLPQPVVRTPSGAPGTGWRTTILPFIGRETLYNSYNLDWPWDAPANSTAARTVVGTYLCPAQVAPSTTPFKVDLLLRGPRVRSRRADGYALTHYSAVTGPNGALRDNEPVRPGRLTGSMGPACLAGEVYLRDWPWACPEDVPWTGDTHPPYSVLGFDSAHDDVIQLLMADGSVRSVQRDIDPALLRRILTAKIAEPDPDRY